MEGICALSVLYVRANAASHAALTAFSSIKCACVRRAAYNNTITSSARCISEYPMNFTRLIDDKQSRQILLRRAVFVFRAAGNCACRMQCFDWRQITKQSRTVQFGKRQCSAKGDIGVPFTARRTTVRVAIIAWELCHMAGWRAGLSAESKRTSRRMVGRNQSKSFQNESS